MLSAARMTLERYPSLTPFPLQFNQSGIRHRLPLQPQGNYTDPCHSCRRVRLFGSSEQGEEVAAGLVSAGRICSATLSLPKGLVSHQVSCWQLCHIVRHETLMQQINVICQLQFSSHFTTSVHQKQTTNHTHHLKPKPRTLHLHYQK